MKILFFSYGSEAMASSRTRVYQYIPYLEKERICCRVINYISQERFNCDINSAGPSLFLRIKNNIFKNLQFLKVLLCARAYDIVFVQRVLVSTLEQKLLKFMNPNIIFDFDDALYEHPLLKRRFENMIKISRHLIIESNANVDYAKRFNPSISRIVGPIDINRYALKEQKDKSYPVVIGWIGSPSTVKYLELSKDVLKALKNKYNEKITIKLIGCGKLDWDGAPYVPVDWRLDTEVKQLQSFDIGIMPLRDDQWCRGKGGYKLLQYMAVGIPCVASPVGINEELVKEGVSGFLVNSYKDWIEKIELLINSRDLRIKMGQAGRNIVEQYSYEAAVPRLISIFKDLAEKEN